MVLIATTVLTVYIPASGQEAHYWTQHYGTLSTLLGGTVIGSAEDLGAVYYNPGRLALLEKPSFLLAAKVFQINSITVEDGVGDGIDLKKTSFGGEPNLVAGSFGFNALKNHIFAYSFLTRQFWDSDFTVRQTDTLNVIDSTPGDEVFAGEILLGGRLKDEWFGLSWAHTLNEKVGIGLSNYVSVRSQDDNVRMLLQALTTSGTVAAVVRVNEFKYANVGLLWKLGAAFDFSPVTAGITVTTPRLNLFGKGSTLFNDLVNDLEGNDLFETNLQKDLNATYKTSWAVGLGAGMTFGSHKLHISAEWYDKVGKSTVLEPLPFIGQSTGDTLNKKIVQELDAVFNYGAGVELYVNKKLSMYGSFTSDFSAATSNIAGLAESKSEINLAFATWDLFHIATGAAFFVGPSEFTLGVTYSFGNERVARPINIPDDRDEPIFDSGETSRVKFARLRFIFGFSFLF